jgi:hypothetical protein
LPTPISGLPELLFDEGFWAYTSFCRQVTSYATTDDAPRDLNIIPFDDNKVQSGTDEDDYKEINMLFMINEMVIFKEGKGITQMVTYLGPVLTDGILKHKRRTQHDTKFLVNGIHLSSLELPDIATIPVTVEQYAVELPKLTHLQLEQISNPQTLDDNQCELMNLHYKMNHLPLPAMITLAEKGKIIKRLAKLKDWLPICMSCIFVMAHRKSWQYKGSRGSI